jgi:predicted permease
MERFPGIRRVFRLGVAKRELDEELAFHFERTVEELRQGGLSGEEAEAEARRRFGSERRWRREIERLDRRAEAWRRWRERAELVGRSLEYALRRMRRSPGFTAGVVLTFALGIGANATMFGIVDRLLLRPPPHVEDPASVRRVWIEQFIPFTGEREIQEYLTYPDFLDLTRAESFADIAAFARRELTVGRGEASRLLDAHLVTGNFFSLLGARPAVGRFFGPEEDRVGAAGVAVISYGMWRRDFGGDRDILSRTLDFGYGPYPIVGVAPRGFTGVNPEAVDFWVPLRTTNAQLRGDTRWMESRGHYWMRFVARLRPGVSPEAAAAEATVLHRQGRREQIEAGDHDPEARALVAPLLLSRGALAPEEAAVAKWLAGISLIVLLIACANVANLLLARSVRQRREIGIRLALGSSRGRLLGQVLAESLLLAAVGGGAALLVTRWGGTLLQGLLLPDVAWAESALDARVGAFVLALTVLAGLVTGLIPALQASRPGLVEELKSGARGASALGSRTRDALTVVQAGLSVVLLVGAGLFVRSLDRVRELDLGLDPRGVLLVESIFDRELSEEAQADYFRRAAERLRALPGVSGASPDISIPFWSVASYELRVPGLDSVPTLTTGGPALHAVAPDYFGIMGLRVTRGRGLLDTDSRGAPPVVVVNETLARVVWPGQEALGKCLIVIRDRKAPEPPCAEVVGVVENARRFDLVEDASMDYYLAIDQGLAGDSPEGLLVGIGDRDPERMIPAIQRELLAVEPGLRHAEVTPLGSFLASQSRSWTLGAAMFSAFGVLALLVAAVGLYSVLAFTVAQRTQELGIRSALGASRERLLGLVLGKGVGLVAAGVLVGLGLALLAGPRLEPLLFQVSPRDPLVLGGVALVLLLVAVVASGAPAWRATRVDPSVALRAD